MSDVMLRIARADTERKSAYQELWQPSSLSTDDWVRPGSHFISTGMAGGGQHRSRLVYGLPRGVPKP